MTQDGYGLYQLAARLRSGKISISDHLSAIETIINGQESEIQALVPEKNRFARLELEARGLEKRFPNAENRPPLYGVPIGVKDIIHAKNFPTRAGSSIPAEILTGPEAKCVTRLRNAGALVLGKTVTTEFAYAASGPTRNPHDRTRTPGGSSSGSAAAVAAGYCTLALGTQTVGSVIRPASFCGVVGFKPTQGRISTQGVIPFSQTLDQVGFFCLTPGDISLAASVLCENWKMEIHANQPPILGLPLGPYLDNADSETLVLLEGLIKSLESSGYVVKKINVLNEFDIIASNHRMLMAHEAARVHEKWHGEFKKLYSPVTSAIIQKGLGIPTDKAERLREQGPTIRTELEKLMESNGLDAWMCPSSVGPAPKGFKTTGNPIMNLPWTSAGLPVASLPLMRSSEGMPIGVQLIGNYMQDEKLAAITRAMAAELKTIGSTVKKN